MPSDCLQTLQEQLDTRPIRTSTGLKVRVPRGEVCLSGSQQSDQRRAPHCQMTTSNQQLVDLDWKFAINVASSENDGNVGSARLYLKLTTTSGNGSERTDLPLSVTLEQFYALVHQLEKAKQEMDMYAELK